MDKTNSNLSQLVVLVVILVLFFLFNNVLHRGFHIGHSHDETDMMGMMDEYHDDMVAVHEISPGGVVRKIKNGEDIVLLDVRTLEEYEEVHLENALLLPVEKLSQATLNEIGLGEDSKDKEIILYCRSGARGQVAYNIMNSLGYTNIKNSAGGIVHWQEDNYPYTESGPYKGILVESDDEVIRGDVAKIAIDRNLHDFGVIPQSGGVVETTFTVKNIGTGDLVIGELTTSCSCTSASISNSNISSGEEAILTVIFDPDFHEEPSGAFKRTVFIPTNDPVVPEAEVVISVDILEE